MYKILSPLMLVAYGITHGDEDTREFGEYLNTLPANITEKIPVMEQLSTLSETQIVGFGLPIVIIGGIVGQFFFPM